MKDHLRDGNMKKLQTETFDNISYNTFSTSGFANYASSTTSPYYGYNPFIQPLDLEDSGVEIGKYNCINVANWFLEKEPMSLGKLQKLSYYSFAWCWALKHYQISKTAFFASATGPISKDIDEFFRDHRNELLHAMPDFLTNFDNETLELLESVWETYGSYTENALIALTETESPWQAAYNADPSGDREISISIMIEFYNSIATNNG